MKLENGKTYRTRDGKHEVLVRKAAQDCLYCFHGLIGDWVAEWTEEGFAFELEGGFRPEEPEDLVEEVLPEANPWKDQLKSMALLAQLDPSRLEELRDFFAGAALQGLLASGNTNTFTGRADVAYGMADAMVAIAQRNRAKHLAAAGVEPTQPE